MKGILVALEGADGSGKTTQMLLLSKRLRREGIETSTYSYPTHDQFYGKIIREQFLTRKIDLSPLDEVCLFLLDMAHDKSKVQKDLAKGKVVFLDRYFPTTVAYQSARGFNYDKIKMIASEVMELPKPSLVLYFDIPAKAAYARKAKQKLLKADRNESDLAFQEKVRQFYQKLFKEGYGAEQWVRLDARKGVKEVSKNALEAIKTTIEASVF